MNYGIVKWFNPTKGYGFVAPESGSTDIFLHISAVEAAGLNNIKEGQRISFEYMENKGKKTAVNIKLA
jgi:CspA family cold shock protein